MVTLMNMTYYEQANRAAAAAFCGACEAGVEHRCTANERVRDL